MIRVVLWCLFLFVFGQVDAQRKDVDYQEVIDEYHLADTLKYAKYTDLNVQHIYAVRNAEFSYFLRQSKKKYKLLYTFTYWCKSCRKHTPIVQKLQKKYADVLDVFWVTDMSDWYDVKKTLKYIKKIDNKNPILAISKDKNNKNPKTSFWKKGVTKYSYFTKNILPNVPDEYGYSLYVLFDENNKVIYSSTYHEDEKQREQKILSFLNKP